jgi:hypothetical protein
MTAYRLTELGNSGEVTFSHGAAMCGLLAMRAVRIRRES